MLSDRVCIVTGAGHGIGRAVAVELGRQGCTVVVNDLGTSLNGEGQSDEPADETAASVREAGGEAMVHFGDITSLEYTEQLVQETVAEHGRLDGVANFAGILRDAMSYDMTGDEWDDVIRVHLRGHFSLVRNAAAHWRDRHAEEDGLDRQRSFVTVSSRAALGNVGQLNYSAAKAGILGLTRTAARELDRYDVRVNALVPTAYTRMIENIPEDRQPFDEEEMPAQKVAPIVSYLMSDEAEDVTGCTLRAAGDTIGVVSDPEPQRLGYRTGGWSAEEIAEAFDGDLTKGIEMNHSDPIL